MGPAGTHYSMLYTLFTEASLPIGKVDVATEETTPDYQPSTLLRVSCLTFFFQSS